MDPTTTALPVTLSTLKLSSVHSNHVKRILRLAFESFVELHTLVLNFVNVDQNMLDNINKFGTLLQSFTLEHTNILEPHCDFDPYFRFLLSCRQLVRFSTSYSKIPLDIQYSKQLQRIHLGTTNVRFLDQGESLYFPLLTEFSGSLTQDLVSPSSFPSLSKACVDNAIVSFFILGNRYRGLSPKTPHQSWLYAFSSSIQELSLDSIPTQEPISLPSMPFLRTLRISTAAKLKSMGNLPNLTSVSIRSQYLHTLSTLMLEHPCWEHIHNLRMDFTPQHLGILKRCKELTELTVIAGRRNLKFWGLNTNQLLQVLYNCPKIRKLDLRRFYGRSLTFERYTSLRELSLEELGYECLTFTQLENLHTLTIAGSRRTFKGHPHDPCKVIIHSLPQLRHITVQNSKYTSDINILLELQHLPRLETCIVSNTKRAFSVNTNKIPNNQQGKYMLEVGDDGEIRQTMIEPNFRPNWIVP